MTAATLEVLATGPLATLQDLGRPGYAALGVPRAGAFDRAALRRANRLVGNDDGALTVEITFGGLRVRLLRAATVALTGAPCTGLAAGAALSLPAGTLITLGPPTAGVRSYLAVRGGIAAPLLLDSGATDTLSGLGPPPLAPGDRLAAGTAAGPPSEAIAVTRRRPDAGLAVRLGPRDDWFTEAARAALFAAAWRVRSESDRIGVRLDGPSLERSRAGELPSEPTRPGAIQVPGDGRPIVFGPDAPVTGGYPVIAVVAEAELDLAAQLRPGEVLRFRPAR